MQAIYDEQMMCLSGPLLIITLLLYVLFITLSTPEIIIYWHEEKPLAIGFFSIQARYISFSLTT